MAAIKKYEGRVHGVVGGTVTLTSCRDEHSSWLELATDNGQPGVELSFESLDDLVRLLNTQLHYRRAGASRLIGPVA